MSDHILRTSLNAVATCVANNNAAEAQVILTAPGIGFALTVQISRQADALVARLGTTSGIGPVETFTGTTAEVIVPQLLEVLMPLFDGKSVRAEVSATPTGTSVIPTGIISSDEPQFRVINGDLMSFLSAAVNKSVSAVASGQSRSSALRVESPRLQWPVWVLIDRSDDGKFCACTNDLDLMTGCGPTFFTTKTTAEDLCGSVLQFLSGQFIDAGSLTVLIRLDQANLTGDSASGPESIKEQEIYDLPV